MVGISENEKVRKRKYRPNSVSFSEAEEIINPGTMYNVHVYTVQVHVHLYLEKRFVSGVVVLYCVALFVVLCSSCTFVYTVLALA